jgi:hypothetical protein
LRAGKFTDAEREATLARISFTTELGDLADRDVVVEAVVENERENLRCSPHSGRSCRPSACWRAIRRPSRS